MKLALIRLEDIGPGGDYEHEESRQKLVAVTDYLYKLAVPFQVAVISRFIDPQQGIDNSMGNYHNAVSLRFLQTLQAMCNRGASLGMHGYTHQYGQSISGNGYEFAYPECVQNCPPDDLPISLSTLDKFHQSYAFRRFHMALSEFRAAGMRPDWFETPHYEASEVQRTILEACSWIMYENNPAAPENRQITFRRSGSIFGMTMYIPTPLGYVKGENADHDVQRIMSQADLYGDGELASFFYHPFLEFPYIHLRNNAPPLYDNHTPLKRIIEHLLSRGWSFVSIKDLI